MKFHKQTICFLYFLLLFASDIFAMKQQKQQFSYFSYLSHPTTLFCAGLTSLSGYCLYDKEASLQAYEWLKQRIDEMPFLVKMGGFGLGLWTCYKFWFNKKCTNSLTERLKVLEESDIDTKVLFAAYEAQYKQDARKINDRFIDLETISEQNETLKKESVEFFQEIVDKIEFLEQPTQVFDQDEGLKEKEARKKFNYIVIPEEVLSNFGNRISNLEIVVLGEVTTPKSFGVGAELKPSRIDQLEKTLNNIEKIVKAMFTKKSGKEKNKSLPTKKLLPSPPAGRGSPRNKGDEGEKHY